MLLSGPASRARPASWQASSTPSAKLSCQPFSVRSGDAVGQGAQGLGIRGVQLDGRAQQRSWRVVSIVFDLGLPEIGRQRAQIQVVGGQAVGRFGTRALDLGGPTLGSTAETIRAVISSCKAKMSLRSPS